VSGVLNIRSRLAGVATGAALALALTGARASDGSITFTGAVTGNSCTLHVGTDQAAAGTLFEITLDGCVASRADASSATPTRMAILLRAVPGAEQPAPALVDAVSGNVLVKLYMQPQANAVTWSLIYE